MNNALASIKAPINPEGNENSDQATDEIVGKHVANEFHSDAKKLEEQLKDSQQNREQRKEYAGKIFYLVAGWLVSLIAIIVMAGFKWLALSDAVIISLITGATVNIIGLMVIVANYLFPKMTNTKANNADSKG